MSLLCKKKEAQAFGNSNFLSLCILRGDFAGGAPLHHHPTTQSYKGKTSTITTLSERRTKEAFMRLGFLLYKGNPWDAPAFLRTQP